MLTPDRLASSHAVRQDSSMIRVASYNVENLFARPKALDVRPILEAYEQVNSLMAEPIYTPDIKQTLIDLLVQLDVYFLNSHGVARRREGEAPRWARLRKNRGAFERQPPDETRGIEIVANGRAEWTGWVELQGDMVCEIATRVTARVIADVNADVLAVIEAEDRPALLRFNRDLLRHQYGSVMLVDGNDERGLELGLFLRQGLELGALRSHVNLTDAVGTVFSRDCPQYEVNVPSGATLHVLVNHFKSQAGGGGAKRARQAAAVRRIAQGLVDQGKHVIVLGDLNEGPAADGLPPANLAALFDTHGPLVSCYDLPGFEVGPCPGTFDACGLRERLDYLLISRSLVPVFAGGAIFRKGLWGSRETRPDAWETYPQMQARDHSASDHAAVYIDLNL
jgi:endonuclease/exonuclease/phosphatase family metal-dependent hydrolase